MGPSAAVLGLLLLHVGLVGTDYVPGSPVQEHIEEETHKRAPWLDSNVPTFVEPLHNVTVSVGREATLTCVVDDLSTYQVAWLHVDTQTILTIQRNVITKNHRIIVSQTDSRTWYLNIKEVREKDRGWYMCQINTEPMKSQVGYLEVVVPPNILDNKTSSDVEIEEGSDVSLSCAATGYPEPTIMWRRENGETLPRGGEEVCGKGGSVRSSLEALDLFRVVYEITGSGDQGSQSSITFRMNGERVTLLEGAQLNMTNVTRRRMGAYLCIASNGVPPTVSKRVLLKVDFPPSLSVPRSRVPAVVGDTAVLECLVEAYPEPIGYWTLPNNTNMSRFVVSRESSYAYRVVQSLNITQVRPSDYGEYKCVTVNALGSAEGSVRLYEVKPTTTRPPPTTPRTITSSTSTTSSTTSAPRRTTPPPPGRRKELDKDATDMRQDKKRKGLEFTDNSVSGKNSREASTRGASRPATSASSAASAASSLEHQTLEATVCVALIILLTTFC